MIWGYSIWGYSAGEPQHLSTAACFSLRVLKISLPDYSAGVCRDENGMSITLTENRKLGENLKNLPERRNGKCGNICICAAEASTENAEIFGIQGLEGKIPLELYWLKTPLSVLGSLTNSVNFE